MWINNITGPNSIIGFNDSGAMSLLKLEKVGFLPNRQNTRVSISIDLDSGRKKKKQNKNKFFKHLFMPLVNLWLHGFVCPSLKHRLGTVA